MSEGLTFINQINQKGPWFAIIGILKILVVDLNHMFVYYESYRFWIKRMLQY